MCYLHVIASLLNPLFMLVGLDIILQQVILYGG
jgi:hypothetical protein